MLDYQNWFEYATFDDEGVNGIREDAPEEIKQEYEKYLKKIKDAEAEGIKL